MRGRSGESGKDVLGPASAGQQKLFSSAPPPPQADGAHLTEGCGPLQRQQEALPGAGARLPLGAAIFVVLQMDFLCAWLERKLQQEQKRRTDTEQQGQHRALHRH